MMLKILVGIFSWVVVMLCSILVWLCVLSIGVVIKLGSVLSSGGSLVVLVILW